MSATEVKRSVQLTVEIEYAVVACDKCGAEWQPPHPDGFESERDFHAWKRARDQRFGGGSPEGWFSVVGPIGAISKTMNDLHICAECVKAFLPVAK